MNQKSNYRLLELTSHRVPLCPNPYNLEIVQYLSDYYAIISKNPDMEIIDLGNCSKYNFGYKIRHKQ